MQEFKGRVGGVTVEPVDTTGAGDAFVSGILNSLASDINIIKVPVGLDITCNKISLILNMFLRLQFWFMSVYP